VSLRKREGKPQVKREGKPETLANLERQGNSKRSRPRAGLKPALD